MKKVVNGADTELSVQMIEHQLRFGVYILRKEDRLLLSYDPLWKTMEEVQKAMRKTHGFFYLWNPLQTSGDNSRLQMEFTNNII